MANFLDIIKGEGPAIAFIRSLVETAASANEILEKLSLEGIGIRRATGLGVIRYLRETAQPARKYISSLTLNALPNPLRLPKSLTTTLRNFTYVTQLEGFSSKTGQLEQRTINVSSNALLTKQQALDVAEQYATGSFQSGGLDSASGTVTDIFQNQAGLVEA